MSNSFDVTVGQQTVKWPQIVAGLSAAGGAFAIGIAMGWPAPSSSRLVGDEPDERYFPISESQFDWIASIITLGCAISCLPIGYLMKKFGRKWTMLTLVIPMVIGWALVIWAQNFIMLLIGRFIIGLAGGAFAIAAPQYSAEIAEKEIRGFVGTFFQLLIITGILFAYVIGAYLTVFVASIIGGIIPLVFGAIFIIMPESPVYLVIEKREEDALKSYKWLRGSSYDPQGEVDELKAELLESEKNQTPMSQIFKRSSTLRALLIGFGLMFFQQMSGINVVIFYATVIFTAADTDIEPDLQTIIVGSVHLVATLAGSLLVDRAGRKLLLIISIIAMTLMLSSLGAFFYLADNAPETAANLGWLPLTSLCIYLVFFAIGYGPVPWLMLSEIYSKEYNAIASPATGAFNWTLAFIITVTFGSISNAIGIGQTFWMFAGVSVVGIFFTIIFVPETKGKSINDIQRMLNGEKIVN